MQDITNALPNIDDKYRLHSINAVSKKLKLGYTKTKELIELGIIESVDVTGRLMVPQCKLEKFVMEGNFKNNSISKNANEYLGDEMQALSIIYNNLKNNKNDGIII